MRGWKDCFNLRLARNKKLLKLCVLNSRKAKVIGNNCVNKVLFIFKIIKWRWKKTTLCKACVSRTLSL